MKSRLLFPVLLLAPLPLAAQTADVVLRGGKVITVNSARRIACSN